MDELWLDCLEQLIEEFMKEGYSEETAIKLAEKHMGHKNFASYIGDLIDNAEMKLKE